MGIDPILMTPGPTQVPPEVLAESSYPVLNHVSQEFDEIHGETVSMLRRLFNSSGVLLIPGSGTAAMELALRLLNVRGRDVLVLKTGYFGNYLSEGVRLLGGKPHVVESSLGRGFGDEDLARLLDEGDYYAVAFQHVDTSTSVANRLRELASVARKRGVHVIVDAVASAGGYVIDVDGR